MPSTSSSPPHALLLLLPTQFIQVEATDTGWPQEANFAERLPPHSKVLYHQILARFGLPIKVIHTRDSVVVRSLQDNPAPTGLRRVAYRRSRLWCFRLRQQWICSNRDYRPEGGGGGRRGKEGGESWAQTFTLSMNFCGVYISCISISTDFASLNSWMLDIVGRTYSSGLYCTLLHMTNCRLSQTQQSTLHAG